MVHGAGRLRWEELERVDLILNQEQKEISCVMPELSLTSLMQTMTSFIRNGFAHGGAGLLHQLT